MNDIHHVSSVSIMHDTIVIRDLWIRVGSDPGMEGAIHGKVDCLKRAVVSRSVGGSIITHDRKHVKRRNIIKISDAFL